MTLKAGDWVEVRSKRDILASLDAKARLDGLPFMPEMFEHCGRRFQVYKRAHKTCDTATRTGGRRLPDGIHLDLRCSGAAHGKCQAECLLFWKESWLKPIDAPTARTEPTPSSDAETRLRSGHAGCTEQDVYDATRRRHLGETRYVCQATELPHYTSRLPWWNASQYVEDYRSGNITTGRLLRGLVYATFNQFSHRLRSAAPFLHWLYDQAQGLWGGIPYPRRWGTIPAGQPTPGASLDLQPGELVRVKSYEAILATLDSSNKNAGLFFDAELVPYCGSTYRVKARVHQFIDEASGKMSFLKTPAVILENVWCRSRYSACRMFCPRSIYSWWREVWLERVPEEAAVVVQMPIHGQEPITTSAKPRLVGASTPLGAMQSATALHRGADIK